MSAAWRALLETAVVCSLSVLCAILHFVKMGIFLLALTRVGGNLNATTAPFLSLAKYTSVQKLTRIWGPTI
jgi:hypothetical protein